MPCKCAPALKAMVAELNALAPSRSKASDGCCGDAAHAARKSDHNPDASGHAHAQDITHDPANGCDAHAFAEFLRATGDPRCSYIISKRRICNPGGNWRPYTGVNPHDKHAHVSIWEEATFDVSPWWPNPSQPQPQPLPLPQEEAMQGRSLRADHSKVEILLSGPQGQKSWVQIISANSEGPRQRVSGSYYIESPGMPTTTDTFVCEPAQSGIFEVEVSEWFKTAGNKILVTAENGEGKPLSIWGR